MVCKAQEKRSEQRIDLIVRYIRRSIYTLGVSNDRAEKNGGRELPTGYDYANH